VSAFFSGLPEMLVTVREPGSGTISRTMLTSCIHPWNDAFRCGTPHFSWKIWCRFMRSSSNPDKVPGWVCRKKRKQRFS